MGLLEYTSNPAALVHKHVNSVADVQRRVDAQARVDYLHDNFEAHLGQLVDRLFSSGEVRAQVRLFVPLAVANSLVKRIATEIARPAYAVPPRRKVTGTGNAHATYRALAREMELDATMRDLGPLLVAANDALLVVRYVDGLGMCLDRVTAATASIIPHPRKLGRALAYAYRRCVTGWNGEEWRWVVWDDQITFEIAESQPVYTEAIREHGFGRAPVIHAKRGTRNGEPFDRTTGKDLVAGALQSSLLNALVIKLHYAQGERVLAVIGDMAPDQTLDALATIRAEPGASVSTLDLATSPTHYLATIDKIETTIAANYGISRARLNQQATNTGGLDEALYERCGELIQDLGAVEAEVFAVAKIISLEHPVHKLPADAMMAVDYGSIRTRVDRAAQLAIRETERKGGTRNYLDDVYEDNPEIVSDEEAWSEYLENIDVNARAIEMAASRNISQGASPGQPGKTPEQNGAMGPPARDGKPDLKALARRALGLS